MLGPTEGANTLLKSKLMKSLRIQVNSIIKVTSLDYIFIITRDDLLENHENL